MVVFILNLSTRGGALLRVAGMGLALAVAACVTVPQAELAAYTRAVAAARASGEQITQDWQAARAELERREASKTPPAVGGTSPPMPIPLTWTPPSRAAAPLTPEQVRLLAWETIGEYSAILAALNAGESVEEVKRSTGRLFGLAQTVAQTAGSAIPGAGPLLTLLQELAGHLERARLAEEFRAAVFGGVPTVRRMLMVFREDAVDHARLRAALANIDYGRVEFEDGLAAEQKREKRLRIQAENEAFRKTLDDFVVLLDEVDRSLAALQSAVDKPIDFVDQSNRILDIVASLKEHWGAYRNARSEGRF